MRAVAAGALLLIAASAIAPAFSPAFAKTAAATARASTTASAASSTTASTTVSLSGSLGDKALLVIDGKPRTLAAGSTVQGVRLVSVSGSEAVVEVQGKRATLRLGGAQVDIGGVPSEGGGTKVVMTADGAGHFFTGGAINGRSVRLLVDTGATYVSLGLNEAERLGIDYRAGRRGITHTANGTMPVYQVTLASVRVGDVLVYDVEALIGQAPMEFVLLGNSFLRRFQMNRDSDTLTLTKRY